MAQVILALLLPGAVTLLSTLLVGGVLLISIFS
jgi:hypothetical protein